eukprot:482362_1
MAQPADDQKAEPMHVWPTSLLTNQVYAATFCCVQCKDIPISCMNDEHGKLFCAKCSRDMDHITPSKAVQNMINNLKTKCLSLYDESEDESDDDGIEGAKVIATQVKDNQCDWTGMIQEWHDHSKQCPFLLIQCGECKAFQCKRKSMDKHVATCPEVTIDCPLSCGVSILRRNTKYHLKNDCNEQLLDCTNDECKMQIKRKEFDTHVNHQCENRVVECEFVKYGCTIKMIKASQMKQHLEEYKFDHISNKFDAITSQLNAKITEQNERITAQNDIISQLHNAIEQATPCAIAEWKSTKREGDNAPVLWDVLKLEPTLKGMAKVIDSNRSIEIGLAGLYRIDVRCQYMTGECGTDGSKFSLKVNGDVIAEFKAKDQSYIRGTMSEVTELGKGDKLSVWCTCGHGMDPLYNHFILQKIR